MLHESLDLQHERHVVVDQSCPLKMDKACTRSKAGVAFQPILSGADLKRKSSLLCAFRGLPLSGMRHECLQHAVCPLDGACTLGKFWAHRGLLFGQRRRATQVYRCAAAIVKKERQRDDSLDTLLQILAVSTFKTAALTCALQSSTNKKIQDPPIFN